MNDRGPFPKRGLSIVSNRPQLAADASAALALGRWTVRYQGSLNAAHANELSFNLTASPGEVFVVNDGKGTRHDPHPHA